MKGGTETTEVRAQKNLAKAEPAEPVVVGICASAGGLDSISNLLRNIPADTGCVFVVVQHLGPRQTSMLPSIFSKTTRMPVTEIRHGMSIEPNHVYVGVPGHDVFLRKRTLGLELREKHAAIDGQIDKFLTSLGSECGRRAVGVILSGTGSDGTAGLREIKQRGGVTFAETKSSAQFPDMPLNAVHAGVADHVLSPAGIAKTIARLAQSSEKSVRVSRPADAATTAIPALEEIFRTLRINKNVDFSGYKPTTIRRRISRRMGLKRIQDLNAYATLVQKDRKEADRLFNDLLINVTGFFRDPGVFRSLEKVILPRLIAEKNGQGDLRIWVPGCATGQEVYSIAICAVEALHRLKATMAVQIFGTDISESSINQARLGAYPLESFRGMTLARRKRHFTRKDGMLMIDRSIRDLCTFAQQNLASDPPFSRLDLISCRNVLIYFGPELQKKCIPQFYYALNPNGFLLLGGSETIGVFANLFSLVDKRNKIYRKKVTNQARDSFLGPSSPRRQPNPGRIPSSESLEKAGRKEMKAGTTAAEILSAADQLILTHFAPCGVVIDPNYQVWHFRGDTSPFVKQLPGAATLNILKLVCRGLTSELSSAIQLAMETKDTVRKDTSMVQTNSGIRNVHIEVVPFVVAPAVDPWLLIIFETINRPPATTAKSRGGRPHSGFLRENSHLREELRSTKESLQSIIEAQDAAGEVIKSANEEIESSNEELQSMNEELETAKEELQSTNEELSTVNDELNNRNFEINELNSDLNNLLSSINVAVVLVDNSLTIRRTTQLAEKLFNIIPSDTGRKLSDINPNFDLPGLPQLIRTVMDDLVPCARDVQDKDGKWYSLRIRPYRTRANVIDGVVITLAENSDRGATGNDGASGTGKG